MIWFVLIAAGVFGAVLNQLIMLWGRDRTRRLNADPVGLERVRRRARAAWMPTLEKFGAAFGLISTSSLLTFFGALIITFLTGPSSFSVGERPMAAGMLLAPLALAALFGGAAVPAVLLCRCPHCAGYVFDGTQTSRNTLAGVYLENWRILRGRGRCPCCGRPLQPAPSPT